MTESEETKGLIFNIQKFSIHDGHGIRTLIFMKGCPLSCVWCCNPESQHFTEEVMFVRKNCIGCYKCVEACPQKAINPDTLETGRALCTVCGACAEVCYANARKKVGRWVTVGELMEEIEKDRLIYRNSGGGITVGGGEPTSQPEFVAALIKECKLLNIHTAIETCGYGQWDRIEKIFDYVEQIFLDLKHMNDAEHKKLTGVSNKLILENARRAASLGKDITFRIPLIPACNDSEENVAETGRFVKGLMDGSNHPERIKIEILPYHGLGADKYAWLDKEYLLEKTKAPEKEVKKHYNSLLKSCGCNVVE